ncbi:MAG: SDR family NAD(P)-dependent oxidoreductase [Novosphingobium sp.]
MNSPPPLPELFRLDGRNALVAGLGPAIGAAVATAFAQAGASVFVTARTSDLIEETVATLRAGCAIAKGLAGDITDPAFREELLWSAGEPDILFYNAYALDAGHGRMFSHDSIFETTDADWEACFRTNMLAPFALARAIAPDMIARGRGAIIHCVAAAATTPIMPAVAYGSTKAGLATMTRYLAKACGPHVRVNAISPSNVAVDNRPEHLALTATTAPLGRMGYPQEVAATALYLASDAASFVTGEVIHVDGGRIATR